MAAPPPPRAAAAKRREIEDPNNTWDMQLMVAVVQKRDTVEAAALLAKGAKIDHTVSTSDTATTAAGATVLKGAVTPYLALCVKAVASANAMQEASEMLAWLAANGADVNRPYDTTTKATFLHHCIKYDLLDGLDRYLALRASVAPNLDLCVRDANGVSPTTLAINTGKHDAARLLLRHGTRHDFRESVDAHGCLAARCAANGDAATLDALLMLGDNPWQLDASTGQSLMHLGLNSPAVVDALIDRGVSVNVLNAHGQSPLLYVVMQKPQRLDLVDLLLQRNADVNLGDAASGMTPLMCAISGYHADLIRKLVIDGKADIATRDAFGATALHWAVAARSKTVLEQLLALDPPVDPNVADSIGETPLHRAASLPGRDEYLSVLLTKEQTDVNAQDHTGRTPLHRAVVRNALSTVKLLLARVATEAPKDAPAAPAAKGAAKPNPKKGGQQTAEPPAQSRLQLDAVDKNGQTALQLAVLHGFGTVAAALIAAGANVHRPTPHGSLLQSCVVLENKALVSQLLGKGAQVNFRNAKDLTALRLAASSTSGSEAAVEIVQLLLKAGACVSDRDMYTTRTPLFVACEIGASDDIIAALLTADPSAALLTDGRMRTPLHVAAERGDRTTIERLLSAGADIDAEDDEGRRPLHYTTTGDVDEAAALLIDSGSSVWLTDANGRSPLHAAVGSGAVKILKLIVERTRAHLTSSSSVADGVSLAPAEAASTAVDGAAARALYLRSAALSHEDGLWRTGFVATDRMGLTPLLLATQAGQSECAKILLRAAVDLGLTRGVPKRRSAAADF